MTSGSPTTSFRFTPALGAGTFDGTASLVFQCQQLDIKVGTVRSRIHRGRSQLREALAHRRPTQAHPRYLGVADEVDAFAGGPKR